MLLWFMSGSSSNSSQISTNVRRRSQSSSSSSSNSISSLIRLTVIASFIINEIIPTANGEKVTFYEHYKRKGKSLQMNINKCTALPKRWQESSSSVDSHDACLTFYENADCTGKYMILRPGLATYVPNLKVVRFNDLISSVKPCTVKTYLPGGRYAIRNMDDKQYLTARNHYRRGFTLVETEPWKNRISQQWDVEKNFDGTYWLIPRLHVTKNPLTYNLRVYKKPDYPEVGMLPERVYWELEHLSGSKYLIRDDQTGKCLVLEDEIEEDECDPELESHQWSFYKL